VSGTPLAAAGMTFVVCVAAGFGLGIVVASRTGASWWGIVGTVGGLFLGIGGFAGLIVRSVK
jgi:hypothetical protein